MSIFAANFGDNIAVLHSMLGIGERYDEWKRIKSGQVHVVIGTRSAVFAPVKNLGLIVLDEEQEATYKSGKQPQVSRQRSRKIPLRPRRGDASFRVGHPLSGEYAQRPYREIYTV